MRVTTDTPTKLQTEAGSLMMIAVIVAVVSWFTSTTPDLMTQVVTALLSSMTATLAAAVGLALVGD